MPPAHMGILWRRSGNPRESKGQSGNHCDEGSVSKAFRRFEPVRELNAAQRRPPCVNRPLVSCAERNFRELIWERAARSSIILSLTTVEGDATDAWSVR